MDKVQALKTANLQDCWSILYMVLGRSLVDAGGVDGEAALREAVRRFGRDRGEKLRTRHLECGLKINLENLFTYYDLPGDPRFKREKIRLNPQERISNTLVCPIAGLWRDRGELALGRVYCEEFHHAMFGTYAKKAQIDLSKTLTDAGDDFCCFAVYLRPANMNPKERSEAFAEFDKDYRLPEGFSYDEGTHKDGFNMLCIKLSFYIVQAALEYLGESGEQAMKSGLQKLALEFAGFLKARADAVQEPLDKAFLSKNYPFSLNMEDDALWREYCDEQVCRLMRTEFYPVFRQALGL